VLAPLHLLKQAVLQHLLLELLQRGFDLVVEDLDLHLGHPEVSRRSMRLVRHGGVDDVHRREPLRSFLDGAGDRLEGIARLLDELTGVVDDAPSPEWILRGGERQDLHLRLPPTPVESPAAARAAARGLGVGELYLQRPSVQLLAVELLDGRIGLLGRRHFDEAEST